MLNNKEIIYIYKIICDVYFYPEPEKVFPIIFKKGVCEGEQIVKHVNLY